MRRSILPDLSALESPQVRRLKDELYLARSTIVDMVREDVRHFLKGYRACESRKDTGEWIRAASEGVIAAAQPIDNGLPDIYSRRAYCPLCGEGSQGFYEHDRGYALPEGLRRHLLGLGNSRGCSVLGAALALAHDSWDSKFSGAEAIADAEDSRIKKQRLATERTYLLSPKGKPVLVDDGYWTVARPPGSGPLSLTWAEQRLFSLGFKIVDEGNSRSYVRNVQNVEGGYSVFADPRGLGKIHFAVYKGGGSQKATKEIRLGYFDIRDSWKNGLAEKVDQGIESAIK
jgi:hypothetical protein